MILSTRSSSTRTHLQAVFSICGFIIVLVRVLVKGETKGFMGFVYLHKYTAEKLFRFHKPDKLRFIEQEVRCTGQYLPSEGRGARKLEFDNYFRVTPQSRLAACQLPSKGSYLAGASARHTGLLLRIKKPHRYEAMRFGVVIYEITCWGWSGTERWSSRQLRWR